MRINGRTVDEVVLGLDAYAQLQHNEHGDDHDDRLGKKRIFEPVAEPEEDSEDVGDEQGETDECAETGCVSGARDHLVLRDVWDYASEDHEATGNK